MDLPPPVESPTRRFTLADAAFLIAALALGTAMARQPMLQLHPNIISRVGWWFNHSHYAYVAAPFLAPATVAVLLLGLRRPRPPRRELFRGPGMVACTAATAGLGLQGLVQLPNYLNGQTWIHGPITP